MDRPTRNRPLLVTGLPRTGTSWVGKMLEYSGEVVYVNEPLNPRHPPGRSPGVLRADVSHQFQYICDDNGAEWEDAFRDTCALRYHPVGELRRNRSPYDLARLAKNGSAFVLGRVRGRRALLDDPYAFFSVRWLVRRLGVTAIVLVRDPVAFAGSWRRLGWTIHFRELLDQPLLLRDLPDGVGEEMAALADSTDDLAKNALLWRTAYLTADQMYRDVPGVHIRRYEDFATRPEESFHELYDVCGLTWTDDVSERILSTTTGDGSAKKSFAWTLAGGPSRTAFRRMDAASSLQSYRERLTEAEIDRVRSLTRAVAPRYYPTATASAANE